MNIKNAYLYLWAIIPLVFAPIFTNQFLPKIAYISLLACIFLVFMYRSRKTISFSIMPSLPWLLFLLILLLTTTNSENVIHLLSYWFLLFLVHLVFCSLEQKQWQKIFKAFTFTAMIVALYGTGQYFWGESVGFPQYTASFSNINAAAAFISATSIFSLSLFVYEFSRKKFMCSGFYFVSSIFQIVYLILTQNRSSWLALAIGFLILLFMIVVFLWEAHRKFVPVILFLAIISGIAVFQLASLNDTLKQRIESIVDTEHPSNKVRILVWDSTLCLANEHFWGGVGTGNFINVFPLYRNPVEYTISSGRVVSHPHNTFLFVYAENGICAILLFCFILIATLKNLWGKAKSSPVTAFLLPVFFTLFVNMLFFFTIISPTTGFLYAAITGIAASRNENTDHKQAQYFLFISLLISLLCLYASVSQMISDLFLNTAQKKMMVKNWESAVVDLEWANKIATNEIIDSELGRCYLAQKKYILARKYFEKSLSSQYHYLENSYLNLGIVYIREQQQQSALLVWKKAIKMYPYSYLLNYNLGKLLLEMGFYEEARSFLHKTQVLFPEMENNVDYLMNLGLTYQYQKIYKTALQYYIKAKELEKENFLPTIYMSQIFMNLNLHSAALHHLENVASKGNVSEVLTANLLMAEIYETIQEPKVALTFYFKVVQQDKFNYQAKYAIAKLLFFEKNYDMAFKFFHQAISISPETPWSYVFVSIIYLEKEQEQEGILFLEKAKNRGFTSWNDFLSLEISEKTKQIIMEYSKTKR